MGALLKNKKGATVIILVLLLTILFPLIFSTIIDFANISRIEKRLKSSLNLSVKSASSRINWDHVPDGDFLIDEPVAEEIFINIFNENMRINLEPYGEYYQHTSPKGNVIKAYMDLYNERHEGSFTLFPEGGYIPTAITEHDLTIKVDRPTVIGIAVVEYKLSPILGGKTIDITGVASSQLNQLD